MNKVYVSPKARVLTVHTEGVMLNQSINRTLDPSKPRLKNPGDAGAPRMTFDTTNYWDDF